MSTKSFLASLLLTFNLKLTGSENQRSPEPCLLQALECNSHRSNPTKMLTIGKLRFTGKKRFVPGSQVGSGNAAHVGT